jgi:phospholipid/cholesterol/gamma-HCH transport system permease protein
VRDVNHVIAVVVAVLGLSLRPGTWRRTVRDALGRQILFAGVESVGLIAVIALVVGVLFVVQAQVWFDEIGQSGLLGPVLVRVVIREVGPLLVNFVVIGRAGNAIAAELGTMKVLGEVRVLDAQGLDPFRFLVVPRVLGMAVSTFCLTVLFVVFSLLSGSVCGQFIGVRSGPGLFIAAVARALGPADLWNLIAKSTVPALLAGAISCVEGLGVGPLLADVRRATTRSLHRSIVALFLTAALISVLTYA